jgi:hypothetical protein
VLLALLVERTEGSRELLAVTRILVNLIKPVYQPEIIGTERLRQ